VASVITYFVVGACLALPAIENRSIRAVSRAWTVPASSGILAVAPDLDVDVPMLLGFPHTSFFGHRGVFHSPLFLILMAAILAVFVARQTPRAILPLAALWAACMITHPLLDALTDGGAGVMLLLPFSTARVFFPWRPIHVAPLSAASFLAYPGYILTSEIPFCAAAAAIGIASLLRIRGRLNFPSESAPRDR
jgi:inner membrane protein